jgi:phosphoribosylglycinamide formyltransferase 1
MNHSQKKDQKVRIAIFASGAGTNAKEIVRYFKDHAAVKISLVVCNKPGAGVVDMAASENVPVLMINREKFFHGDAYLPELQATGINFIVLAGFLWKIPGKLLEAFPHAIINIHPALLPEHGGKGMYGNAVHEAVIAAGKERSGITIHFVDEHYDNGDIIFQASCPVLPGDTAAILAKRIHELEHKNYPKVIENIVTSLYAK